MLRTSHTVHRSFVRNRRGLLTTFSRSIPAKMELSEDRLGHFEWDY